MSSVQTLSRSSSEMEQAYLEYRRACYYIVYRHAQTRGLLEKLTTPQTIDEISETMGFLPQRRLALELFLKALTRFGCLTVIEGSPMRYLSTSGFADKPVEFDHTLIARAIGSDKVESLIHGQSYAGIIDTLYEKENRVAADFVNSNMKLWNEFLQTPFYRYSRDRALHAIATPAGRVLDLACGPGFGLVDLGGVVGADGLAMGLERSRDFVSEALTNTEALPQVRVMHCDLDKGFPFLRDAYFDGAMNVGAFHFLEKRMQLFEHVARVLKPGGKFCVAYTYMQYGSYDQELMDLRFLLREPPSQPPTREEMLTYAQKSKFKLAEEFTMGCFGSFVFVKEA
jgi:SAM-dependent methyltransferase